MEIETLRNRVAALVAAIWGLVAIAAIFTRDYTELGIVTPVMMLIGGFLFAVKSTQHSEPEQKHERRAKKHKDDLSDWGGG